MAKCEIPNSFWLVGTHSNVTFCSHGKPLMRNTTLEFYICCVLELPIVFGNLFLLYETINMEYLIIVTHMRLVKR